MSLPQGREWQGGANDVRRMPVVFQSSGRRQSKMVPPGRGETQRRRTLAETRL